MTMVVDVLDESPSLGPLYARAALPLLPGARRITRASRHPTSLPDVVLELPGVGFDSDRLGAYRAVCGFPAGETVPATYPHILAFPLHLRLLTRPDFPFPAMGVVHVGNRIVQRRPLRPDEAVSLRVWAEDLRPHPRGRLATLVSEATLVTEATPASGTVVETAPVWREESVVLARGTGAQDGEHGARPDTGLPATPPDGPMTWRLQSDLGRRYASASGDRNPIHLFDVTAKPFGFRRHIAHGMWTKARALAALSNRLPDRFEVEVAFKKPIFLPGTVTFGARDRGQYVDFGVKCAPDTTHLIGRATRI